MLFKWPLKYFRFFKELYDKDPFVGIGVVFLFFAAKGMISLLFLAWLFGWGS